MRTTASSDAVPDESDQVRWSRQLPKLEPAYRDVRLQFDAGYEPIAFGGRVIVSSSHDDSVTAFDQQNGEQIWKFWTDGPVRFAPAGGEGRVIFGSDDGCVYCVKASDGELVWKFRAVPSERKLIGNGRLTSVWPVRGGPVLKDDRVYFAAGVWPLEGVFVYSLDAATGDVVWLNDRTSYIYGQQPHNTEAYGGLAPQGYLLIDGDELIVPCSNAYPAKFDLATGKLREFELPAAGRLPGGWFAATPPGKDARRGVIHDESVNQKRHEDRMRSEGEENVRAEIRVRDRVIELDGAYSRIVANGDMIAAFPDGKLVCYGKHEGEPASFEAPLDLPKFNDDRARQLLNAIGSKHGFALLFGEDDPIFLGTLAQESELRLTAIHPQTEIVEALRMASPFSAAKVAFREGSPDSFEAPPFFASLISVNDNVETGTLERLYKSLRPFGGCLTGPADLATVAKTADLPGSKIESANGLTIIRRAGAPEGSTNYLGDWKESHDLLVKAPLGVLWFGDEISHFKRAPQPKFIDGVMISVDKDWTDASTRVPGKVDYRLLDMRFSDVYTGREFGPDEVPVLRQSFADVDQETIQPSQYRPPPGRRAKGKRINPLTGIEEQREFPKRYGCDGGLNYGGLFTMRSGTAAFYDLTIDSGAVNISGPRSGCTNSVIPANGVLNVPYFYEGCTCSYPLPMALSLVSMPETFEQWMSWGEIAAEELSGKIQRIGINFGAPGDRKTEDGTLWLDYPNIGGPSPQLQVKTTPAEPEFFYNHSLRMEGGEGWPWVAASGVRGLDSVTVSGIKPGNYRMNLVFAAWNDDEPSFDVSIQNQPILSDFQAEELRKAITHSVEDVEIREDGELKIQFGGKAMISGIELLPEG
ncbi:MAG: PQQ-binding-like beta-propeller repeat protein [Verrucomicrobiota bacterium]